MTNDDEMIAASQSQPLGPRTGATGRSEERGLKQSVRMSFPLLSSVVVGAFSRVTKASILSWSLERSETVLVAMGRRRSSMVRSAEALKEQMRRTLGDGEPMTVVR